MKRTQATGTTGRALSDAYTKLGQVNLRWTSGAYAKEVYEDLQEVKRLIEEAEMKLMAHFLD
ncbi:hypothetical protein H7H48_15730 [Nitratireductor sp. B36]|uniref:hypothetical protein n=1 Tax=Nitratireductor sp. B36 TaxID=2762059 RepID=UPI001E5D2935|nr:hypothetical protein [Nitratireductor sp. B36]MCC5780511.1 hypothetical protein [Nitratireductor sp. B36]